MLNQAVKRNIERFPADFVFRLTGAEVETLRFQSGTSNDVLPEAGDGPLALRSQFVTSRSQIVILKRGQNIKFLPYAFTEQGVAMLSSVLRSARAVAVNVEIMRAFVRMRRIMLGNADLAKRLAQFEKKYDASSAASSTRSGR